MHRFRLLLFALALASFDCGGQAPTAPSSPPPATVEPPPTPPGPPPAPGLPPPGASGCARTSVGFRPLTDLGPAAYQGRPGGLYPGGTNNRPPQHDAAGVALARAIGPLDASGRPSSTGRYVFTSIGISNATLEFSAFKPMGDADPAKDPRLAIVDGAQSGVLASEWQSASCPCWSTLDQRLRNAGLSPAQVTVAWVKLADGQPSDGWPSYAQRLKDETIRVLQVAKTRFPNLQIAYLSSRIYAGYATTPLNPEPYAYESGFSVKWLVEDQINGSSALTYSGSPGPAQAPWVAWGPYLWADGLTARSDGLTWSCSEFESDGTHPGPIGERKVGRMILDFVKSDATAREWFVR